MKRSREQLVAEDPLRRALQRMASNPEALRVVVCVGLLIVGRLLVLGPLGARLASAHEQRDAAREELAMAEAALHHAAELERLAPRTQVGDDVSEWQAWVLQRVEAAGLKLLTFEPRGAEDTRGFRILEFDVSALADEYAAVVDLLDRLEHGERMLRVSVLQLGDKDGKLILSATLLGLVDLESLGGSGDA